MYRTDYSSLSIDKVKNMCFFAFMTWWLSVGRSKTNFN